MIPFININAKNYSDFGFQLGSKLKSRIKLRIKANKKIYRNMGFTNYSEFVDFSKKFLPAIRRYYPELFDQVEAMSLGADVDFDDLLVLMCEEEFIDSKLTFPRCTNAALRTYDNKILLGHNEDWIPGYKNNGFYIVNGKIGKNKFLSLNFIGSLHASSCAITNHGFAFTINSLEFKKLRYKIPRSFQLAKLLEIKNIKDISKILDFKKSSITGNTMFVWMNSEILDIEEFWGHIDKFEEKNWFVHTNHPLLKEDQNRKNTRKESITRYNRAVEIILNESKLNVDTLKKILSDHKAKICDHSKGVFKINTVASAIMNPKEKWMMICDGNPCRNKYKKYYLK
ncbi:hypothetical protein HYT56_03845 [Candidatus Woesearchaeota archaeon]|nr:hypothetical protein [Candidatus Woesearchaeota archaeon]